MSGFFPVDGFRGWRRGIHQAARGHSVPQAPSARIRSSAIASCCWSEGAPPSSVRRTCQLWPVACLAAAASSRGEIGAERLQRLQHQFARREADQPDMVAQLDAEQLLALRSRPRRPAPGNRAAGWPWARRAALARALAARQATVASAGQHRRQRRRIGHFGGVDQAQQRHRRRLMRVGRDPDVLQALEQQLPQAVEIAPAEAARRARPPPRAPRPTGAGRPRRPALARVTAWSDSISPRSSEPGRSRAHGPRRAGPASRRASPASSVSSRRRMRPRSAWPSMSRTCSAVTLPSPWAIAWSRIDRPSRAEPSAARAMACERLLLDLDAFGLGDIGEMLGELLGRDAAQVEPLAARQDGDRHLVHFGRGEQEFHMRRRLLERLQERVERALRQHVDLVDDVDFVARARPRRSAPPR